MLMEAVTAAPSRSSCLSHRPATSCNCSICRRRGAIWAYYEFGTVRVSGHPEHTQEYIQGDRTLRTIRCATCGCVTHWEPLDAKPASRHGVNLRNFEPRLLESVVVRRFDGADTPTRGNSWSRRWHATIGNRLQG